jgi:predicted metal-binding protein
MKKVLPKRFSEFVEVALRAGATAARIIPSEWVVIDERVRFKCEVPRCAGYGQYLTCPPYVMSEEIWGTLLKIYTLRKRIKMAGMDQPAGVLKKQKRTSKEMRKLTVKVSFFYSSSDHLLIILIISKIPS